MKVRMTFEFSDDDRLTIARHYGEKGKATRSTVEAWLRATVIGELESMFDIGDDE